MIGGVCQCPSTFVQSGSTCVCPSQTTLYNGVCYTCNIQYCTQCQADGVCSTCMATFSPSSTGSQCICPDNSFTITNSACTCAAQTTLFNNHCFSCTPQYCTQCQTDNVCSTCSAPFVAANGVCACPPTYVQQGNNPVCICPSSFV